MSHPHSSSTKAGTSSRKITNTNNGTLPTPPNHRSISPYYGSTHCTKAQTLSLSISPHNNNLNTNTKKPTLTSKSVSISPSSKITKNNKTPDPKSKCRRTPAQKKLADQLAKLLPRTPCPCAGCLERKNEVEKAMRSGVYRGIGM